MVLDLEKIKEAVVRACSSLDCIYALLFGSVARGDARDYSDIDIL
jgi:predicted nucleotidyltransferase